MPGLVAIADADNSHSKDNELLISVMTRSIKHEDFQRTETSIRQPLYVGRSYLGITNAELQPIWNEDGSVCIFLYGEVFGYEEEMKGLQSIGHKFRIGNDAEFCLHLFEERGKGFLRELNGSFVLLIYDSRSEQIIAANDRFGSKQLYYSESDCRCVFSSEVKAILKDENVGREIDHEAIADFFAFGKIFGDKTFFKRIKLMPPASVLVWSKGRTSIEKYWDFEFDEDKHMSEEQCIEKLAILFKKAAEREIKGRRRLGVFLSGGMDSRLIASSIDRKLHPVNTFTYGYRNSDEVKIAEQVAKRLGTRHRFMEMRSNYLVSFAEQGVYQTDGLLNIINFWWISLLPEIREDVDVMFHGTGLDILLSSQWYGTKARQFSRCEGEVFDSLLYKEVNSLVTEEEMPKLFSKAYYEKIRKCPRLSFKKHLATVRAKNALNKIDSFFLKIMGRFYLSSVILRNYCEECAPGLDNDFFEFILKIPMKIRCNSQELYFKVLSRLSPEAAKVPYQLTGVAPTAPMIAHKIGLLIKGGFKYMSRKLATKTRGKLFLKHRIGYPDVGAWIREDKSLRLFFENILLDRRTLNRDYFNPEYVAEMVKDHMSGKKDWSIQLCALVTFELWNRLFVDARARVEG